MDPRDRTELLQKYRTGHQAVVDSLANLRRSVGAARRRSVNIQPAEPDRMAAG